MVPTNIVEGCARRSLKDYLHFINLATGSASEVRYLLGLARRLEILAGSDEQRLVQAYDELIRGLQKLTSALKDAP